jgi:hypothetical protein
MPDEKANIFKVRYLYGRHGRICGRHKREGGRALPGEVCRTALSATTVERRRDGSAEVSRGHSRSIDRTEGPNVKCVAGALNFDEE